MTAPANASTKTEPGLPTEAIAATPAAAVAPSSEPCGPLVAEIVREMQVPLSSLLLGSQTLEKLLAGVELQGNPGGLERIFKIFQQACQQQQHLIETLLTLVQDHNRQPLQTEPLTLSTWLPKMLAAECERARLWQQQVEIAVAPAVSPLVTSGIILARVLAEMVATVSYEAPLGGTIALAVWEADGNTYFDWSSSAAIAADPEALEALQCLQERERQRPGGASLSLARKLAQLLGGELETPAEAAIAYRLRLPQAAL